MSFKLSFASDLAKGLAQTTDEKLDKPLTPLFRSINASNSLLSCYNINGYAPTRKTWNFDGAQDTLPEGFKLKTVEHRDWKLAKNDHKLLARGKDPFAPEAPPDPFMPDETRLSSTVSTGGLESSASAPTLPSAESSTVIKDATKPLKKVDKYYKALMKAQREREETKAREEYEEFLARAEKAAQKAKKAAERLERDMNKTARTWSTSSSKEEDEEEESDGEDPGPLKAYPGVMKIEVEVCVARAPGGRDCDEESFSDKRSTATPSTARSKSESDDGVDWAAELQALQEEFQEPEKDESSSDESLPDGLDGRNIGNIDANDAKRVALGLGGTAFFVPDVERYALAPSLLPPPPRGEGRIAQIGKKRLRIKPRLPLEVSKHRWRDEHPYGCPLEDEFTPDIDDHRRFEDKIRLVEFYGSLNSMVHHMPKADGIRKMPKKDNFDQMLDYELRNSLAWKQYIKRQRLLEIARTERQDKLQQKQAETDKLLQGMVEEGAKAPETRSSTSAPTTGDVVEGKATAKLPERTSLAQTVALTEKLDVTIKKPPPVPGSTSYIGSRPPPIKRIVKAAKKGVR